MSLEQRLSEYQKNAKENPIVAGGRCTGESNYPQGMDYFDGNLTQ